jgi:hypothetical protein
MMRSIRKKKEASRITSNTARAFGQNAKETVQVQRGEDEQIGGGRISVGGSNSSLSLQDHYAKVSAGEIVITFSIIVCPVKSLCSLISL